MNFSSDFSNVAAEKVYKYICIEKDWVRHDYGFECCSSLSAIHILINDCRGTPKRWASLSRRWIIQMGKSTLTVF